MTDAMSMLHSTLFDRIRQSRRGLRLGAWCLLLGVLTGCGGIYHETRTLRHADPCARLELRLEEARTAARRAREADATLKRHEAHSGDAAQVQADRDRLQLTVLDCRRRIQAARDAAGDCPHGAGALAELEQLETHLPSAP